MKNKILIKNSKIKFYHKLINNEVIYNNKPINRYKKNSTLNKNSELMKDRLVKLRLGVSYSDLGVEINPL